MGEGKFRFKRGEGKTPEIWLESWQDCSKYPPTSIYLLRSTKISLGGFRAFVRPIGKPPNSPLPATRPHRGHSVLTTACPAFASHRILLLHLLLLHLLLLFSRSIPNFAVGWHQHLADKKYIRLPLCLSSLFLTYCTQIQSPSLFGLDRLEAPTPPGAGESASCSPLSSSSVLAQRRRQQHGRALHCPNP